MCTNYLNNKTCLFNVVDIWTTKQTYRKDYVGLIQDNMNGWRGNMFAKGNLIACDNSIGILCGIYIYHMFLLINQKDECFHANYPNQDNSWSLTVLWIKERTDFEIVGLLPWNFIFRIGLDYGEEVHQLVENFTS